MPGMLATVDMTEICSESFWQLFEQLDSSLDPAGPEQLFEFSDPYLGTGYRILDVGCRDARHLIELVRRYEATGWVWTRCLGMSNERRPPSQVGLSDRIAIRLGTAENLDEETASFDTVWCRT